jgi:hypothetical protein
VTTRREPPRFTGVIIQRDPRGRFTARHPSDWPSFEIRSDEPLVGEQQARSQAKPPKPAPGKKSGRARKGPKVQLPPLAAREGIGFAPNPDDPHTAFTIWVSPLQERVVAEDLKELREGIDAGLAALEDCQVEHSSEMVLGNLLRFERIYTFREREPAGMPGSADGDQQSAIRKRKQWLLYVDRWLMCLTWQGSSPEEYEYWLAMANQTFLTFEIPEALWFYTDRELLAQLDSGQGVEEGTER